MKKYTNLLPVIIIIAFISYSFMLNKAETNSEINWMTWEEVQEAQKTKPKKVFVDVYTNWCGWCKKMDATTFHNEKIVSYINKNYYAIKFNAETRETIQFKNQKYNYVKHGSKGYNELAGSLLDGNMSFPSTVYLDEKLEILTTVGGYLEPKTIEPILYYFATNSHLKMKWSKYEESFKSLL